MRIKNKKAFTLIEMLVVAVIIAILAAIALPNYMLAIKKARHANMFPLVKNLQNALQRCVLISGEPASPTNCANLAQFDITIRDKDGNIIDAVPEGATSGVFLNNDYYLSHLDNGFIISRTTYGGPDFYRWLLHGDGGCTLQTNNCCSAGRRVVEASGHTLLSPPGNWPGWTCFP